ncbi:hypothetical protein OPT61_g2362 [Boeremia exigua]|uniref:Uncharacterized protein n=1 Tax=Boeremia exigua TaxID=749465 RepID=A0ACC2IM18_9PLEO|nr:hypothetical protein OPT61_g2362 [Boeremia exigua]
MSTPLESSNLVETALSGPVSNGPSPCPFHEWQNAIGGIELDMLCGKAKDCIYCGVIIDALETWHEFAEARVVSIGVVLSVRYSLLELSFDSLYGHKKAAYSDVELAEALPKWTEGLESTRLLAGDTSSTDSLDTLGSWLSSCDYSHSCANRTTDFTPERLIEIIGDFVFLREKLMGGLTYACLSHCWGVDGLQFKLKKANKHEFYGGIKAQELPKTFQDAVRVCQHLNIRYLWVDALCIVQDDITDWNKTAAAMAEIYRHGYVTIAATASRSSSEGIFRRVENRSRTRPLRRMQGLAIREHRWPDYEFNPGNDYGLEDYPLLRRAWVYQERRMFPRMVHFTSTQLVWECRHYIKGEDGTTLDGEESQDEAQSLQDDELASRVLAWHTTVIEYSCLELTFEEDRLPAIAALVVEEMKMRPNDTYIAGLWKSTLLQDLLWTRLSNSFTNDTSGQGNRPQGSLPSWSWASITGSVFFHATTPLSNVRVVDVSLTPSGLPQMGNCRDASITLAGPLLEATFQTSESKHVPRRFSLAPGGIDAEFPESHGLWVSPDFGFLEDDESVKALYDFYFLPLGVSDNDCYHVLVLLRQSDTEYKRVGTCEWTYCGIHISPEARPLRHKAIIDNIPVKEVKII